MFKFYVSASFPRKENAKDLADMIERECEDLRSFTSWIHQPPGDCAYDQPSPKYAVRDVKEILAADIFIQLTGDEDSHGGRHTELGVALAVGKLVFIYPVQEHVIHWHPNINVCFTVDSLLLALRGAVRVLRVLRSHDELMGKLFPDA